MKRILLCLLLAGCGPAYVLMVNEQGERVTCERPVLHSRGLATIAAMTRVDDCVTAHEQIGFRKVN